MNGYPADAENRGRGKWKKVNTSGTIAVHTGQTQDSGTTGQNGGATTMVVNTNSSDQLSFKGENERVTWIWDTGASAHMTRNLNLLSNVHDVKEVSLFHMEQCRMPLKNGRLIWHVILC